MADNSLSNQIYLSRDAIRNQMVSYMQYYLELENVDLTKSSFLSYMVNVLSTLTSNLFFYEASVYREFFLTKAQLPESIFNLSAFLGYNTQEAQYATVNTLVVIPLTFTDSDVSFSLAEGFKFYAGSIEFITYYDTTITVTNNATVEVQLTEENRTYSIPVSIDTTAADPFFSFVLPTRQLKVSNQEFQVDEDLQDYQFTTIDVPITGKVSSLDVQVQEPDSPSLDQYEEFTSLYLMTSYDRGYVARRTDDGRKLYFGNNLLGVQPAPGSTVFIEVSETEGEEGNVISGAVTRGDRIYHTSSVDGITRIVNYAVTNPSPAVGGENEETLEEIRTNSIASLTALGRLVSENDFAFADVIVVDSPIAPNSIPVLKRSDVRTNEIQLFTSILYGTVISPTRNAWQSFTLPQSGTDDIYIPRNYVIDIDGVEYITLFDLEIDWSNNRTCHYHYILYEIVVTPSLVTTYPHDPIEERYSLSVNSLKVYKEDLPGGGGKAHYELYISTPASYPDANHPDKSTLSCEMYISQTNETYTMTNMGDYFEYVFDSYEFVPEGPLFYEFTITHPDDWDIATYATTVTFRQPLDRFMNSNIMIDATAVVDSTAVGEVTVYDIPVVKKNWYDNIVQRDFELVVLQAMLENMTFEEYRMLTDFVNVKFTNASGTMRNMLKNETTKSDVIDIRYTLPASPARGDRYIFVGEGQYRNYIAQCTDATNVVWYYERPVTDELVYVTNKASKYIYTDIGWVVPAYEIPLQIELEVFKSTSFTGSDVDLANTVRDAIIAAFTSRFGSNIDLYRSEIIDVVQTVDGVEHCRLLKPESSIYFNFDIDDFTQQELLEYAPEYIYFDEDDITIRIYTGTS